MNWFTRFREPHSKKELVTYLRHVANEIEGCDGEVLWTHLYRQRDVEEGEGVQGDDGRMWATWEHTGGGELQVKWEVEDGNEA